MKKKDVSPLFFLIGGPNPLPEHTDDDIRDLLYSIMTQHDNFYTQSVCGRFERRSQRDVAVTDGDHAGPAPDPCIAAETFRSDHSFTKSHGAIKQPSREASAGSSVQLKHFIRQSCLYSSASGRAHSLTLANKVTVATKQRLLQGTDSIINSYFHTDKHYYFPKGFDGFVFNTAAQFGSRLSFWEGCGCLGFSSIKHRHVSRQLAYRVSFSVPDC